MVSAYGIALIPVIIGLVQIARQLGLPKQFLPLASVIIGIIVGLVFAESSNWREDVLTGIWLGLGATGMHSGFKNTVNGTFKNLKNGNGKNGKNGQNGHNESSGNGNGN